MRGVHVTKFLQTRGCDSSTRWHFKLQASRLCSVSNTVSLTLKNLNDRMSNVVLDSRSRGLRPSIRFGLVLRRVPPPEQLIRAEDQQVSQHLQ